MRSTRDEIQIGIDEAERGELAPLDLAAIKTEGRRRLALADLGKEIAVGIDALERGEYREFSSTDELLEAISERASSSLPLDEAHESQ